MIYRYRECGDLHNGFARVRCKKCGHEYLLAFSCRRRHFCPSCHQKRVVEFSEWLCERVLNGVPHRHFLFSIPTILRRYFLSNGKLISELTRCAWQSLKVFFQETVPEQHGVSGAAVYGSKKNQVLSFQPSDSSEKHSEAA
ncbi:MAG: hypothetical protein GTO14_01745 [Anaerolineales bacterium]|nr:hypothetical protein [Anaerolineales bacterium]